MTLLPAMTVRTGSASGNNIDELLFILYTDSGRAVKFSDDTALLSLFFGEQTPVMAQLSLTLHSGAMTAGLNASKAEGNSCQLQEIQDGQNR